MVSNSSTHSFLTSKEVEINELYLKQGYFVGPACDKTALSWLRNSLIRIVKEELNIEHDIKEDQFLDLVHEEVSKSELNDFRVSVIQKMNSLSDFRQKYFQVAKQYLDAIVGNELSMQVKVNLSIQLPGDDSSLLPIHADTWSGDSPFEVVVWIPLVDCYKTKSMYIVPPEENDKLDKNFAALAGSNSESLYEVLQEKLDWIEVDYGNVLVFNQALPHGNRVNLESETRWSMNCRFKGVFSPYWDKKLGSFFEPITLRPASIIGMKYKLPELN